MLCISCISARNAVRPETRQRRKRVRNECLLSDLKSVSGKIYFSLLSCCEISISSTIIIIITVKSGILTAHPRQINNRRPVGRKEGGGGGEH